MNEFIAKAKHLAQRSTTWDAARSGASSLKARLASALGVSPVTAMRVLLAGVPLALLYLSLRMLEFSFLADVRHGSAAVVIGRCLPLASLVLLVPVFAYAVLRTQYEDLSASKAAGACVVLGLVLAAVLSFGIPDYFAVTRWFSAEAFEWVRWDLLIIITALVGAAILMERARTHPAIRWPAYGFFCLTVTFLCLLPVLVVGHMLTMGAPGGWHAIKYFLFFSSDLLPIIADELTPVTAGLLAAPFVMALGPFALTRLSPVRRWAERQLGAERDGTAEPSLPLGLVVLGLGILLLIAAPHAKLSLYQSPSLYAGFTRNAVQDLLTDGPAPLADPSLGEGKAAVPFQSSHMKLAATDSTRHMNVAFIILESTRRRSTTPYGGPDGVTPFLDSLAGRSLLVEDMFTQVPQTNKSLTPLFAGIPPHPTIEIAEARPGGVPGRALPTLLEQHGYQTAFFSPVKLGFQNKRQLLRNLGFNHRVGKKYIDRHSAKAWKEINSYGYADEAMLGPAATWLDEAARDDAPFFAAFLTCVTHHPYTTPSSYQKHDFTDSELNGYYNALHYQDGFLRRLLDLFKERGLLDSTLFVIVADHGEAFGEHGVRTHGNVVWEEGLKIPCLLFNPRLFPDGGTIEGYRQHLDLLPTVADALNYDVKDARLPGRSLLKPSLSGTRTLHHITRNPNWGTVLRRDSMAYLYFYRRRPMEIYNTVNDPKEKHDLADQFSGNQRRSVEREVLRWRRSVERGYASSTTRQRSDGTAVATGR